ncbi:MAG: Thiamine-monophosphate kinase [Promethearchaeota archaeon]|nr:MAG: Thiamine-monophosphate kinase [Candidatus Lokiarchaeota archaeon]
MVSIKKNTTKLNDLGETKVIEFIEDLILKKTGKKLIKDDSFFFSLKKVNGLGNDSPFQLVLNSDMLVSTTDVPQQMNPYQIGRKASLMNISDLIVKGVNPQGIIISFGLQKESNISFLKQCMEGILDYTSNYNMEYLGGDINQTEELIINPTVFGFQDTSKILYRKGIQEGDILITNGKFGLTGVGFDILLKRQGSLKTFPKYKKSIDSILNPKDLGQEALILGENQLATSAIDSSDGLAKSLRELMRSNPKVGFELIFDENLIAEEAYNYSKQNKSSLDSLVFQGGEEFIHLFTIPPENLKKAKVAIEKAGGNLYEIGRAISEEKILYLKDNQRVELKDRGYEHFD